MRWFACLAGLLIATTAMALSMVAPPPTWIRISEAQMVLIGRYLPAERSIHVSDPGPVCPVAIDTLLSDRRTEIERRSESASRARVLLEFPGPRVPRDGRWIVLLGPATGGVHRDLIPIPFPKYAQDVDRLLIELADSIRASRNPNFHAVEGFLEQVRDTLPLDGGHGMTRYRATP